jgi:transposase-like protein
LGVFFCSFDSRWGPATFGGSGRHFGGDILVDKPTPRCSVSGMASVLNEPYFNDEQAAFDRLEEIVWPNGPVCPHCGCLGRIRVLNGVKDKAGRERIGLKKCYDCRKQLTVRVGTIFEKSHVPLHMWFQAAYLLCSSKKGISANQLSRTLGVTLQTGWFMGHRLREAMRTDSLVPMGGVGAIVEADETFLGNRDGARRGRGPSHKRAILTLVERKGSARSFHIERAIKEHIVPIVKSNIDRETHLMTDEAGQYIKVGKSFSAHSSVDHSREEYAYTDRITGIIASVNTAEGFFSIFKRGMKGIYQHCQEKHLHRYLAEFDFRYSNRVALGVNDGGRTENALKGIVGKRLTYRDSLGAAR